MTKSLRVFNSPCKVQVYLERFVAKSLTFSQVQGPCKMKVFWLSKILDKFPKDFKRLAILICSGMNNYYEDPHELLICTKPSCSQGSYVFLL